MRQDSSIVSSSKVSRKAWTTALAVLDPVPLVLVLVLGSEATVDGSTSELMYASGSVSATAL